MAEQKLDAEHQAWIEQCLNEWGAWVFSGLDFDSRMNMIAKLMRSVEADCVLPEREKCSDEVGMLIDQVLGYYIKTPCPQDYEYLYAKYVFGRSVYAIAKWKWRQDKSVTFRTWVNRVQKSITASEWVVAKYLDLVIKNHKNAEKLKKVAFFS